MASFPASPDPQPMLTRPACRRCGRPLGPPYQFCASCGASQSAAQSRGSRVWIILAACIGGLFVLVPVIGILAAIAIPNFMRYQLRSKASEARANLAAIVRGEEAYRQGTGGRPGGGYLPFPHPLPAHGMLGTQKMPWSAEDLAVAEKIDWIVQPRTYARYHVAVAGGGGHQGMAISACAETDLDGDGNVAATVVWLPAYAPDHSIEVAPPDAPCTGHVELAQGMSLRFDPNRTPPGVTILLSPDNVF